METTTKEKLEKAKELEMNFGRLSSSYFNKDLDDDFYFFINTLKQQAKELLEAEIKGCGKLFTSKIWGKRKCGNFESLKHSNHFIYCPTCQEENKQANEKLKLDSSKKMQQ